MNALSLGSMSRAADSNRHKSLVAGRAYAAGEPVLMLDHVTWRADWRRGAVRHPSGRYFQDPLLDGVVHGDNPNCRFSFELMALIARRDIRAGEVISNDFGGNLDGAGL